MPCNPDLDKLSYDFWPQLTNVICHTQTSWSIFGSLNAREHAADNAVAKCCLLCFLIKTKGINLWQHSLERNWLINWTSQGWHSKDGGNIINRVIVSHINLADFDIRTNISWIPGTDHRPVVAHVVLQIPGQWHDPMSQYTPYMLAPSPHIEYPTKSNKHKSEQFSSKVDLLIEANKPSFELAVTDDDAFMNRYAKLTTVLEIAAITTFGHITPFKHSNKEVTLPCICQIVSRIQHVGGAISMARG